MRSVRTIAGDTANVVLYRELGRSDDEAEEAFWLLNKGLADYGPVLPGGVRVFLPELEERATVSASISAWD